MIMGERPSYDEYFMEMAHVVSKRSTCLRRKVGAILVKDRHILSTGYNGAPKGLKHCKEVGCLREDMNVPSGKRHELRQRADDHCRWGQDFEWIGLTARLRNFIRYPFARTFLRQFTVRSRNTFRVTLHGLP